VTEKGKSTAQQKNGMHSPPVWTLKEFYKITGHGPLFIIITFVFTNTGIEVKGKNDNQLPTS
jgi:hypothetical protein